MHSLKLLDQICQWLHSTGHHNIAAEVSSRFRPGLEEFTLRLNNLQDAIDSGRNDEARVILKELNELYPDDPDVFFYEQLLPPE